MFRPFWTFILWISYIVIAFITGTVTSILGQENIIDDFDTLVIKLVSGFWMIAVISWIHAVKTRGPKSLHAAVYTGLIWAVCNAVFEIFAAQAMLGYTWSQVAQMYYIWEGQPFGFILLGLLLGPIVAKLLVRGK